MFISQRILLSSLFILSTVVSHLAFAEGTDFAGKGSAARIDASVNNEELDWGVNNTEIKHYELKKEQFDRIKCVKAFSKIGCETAGVFTKRANCWGAIFYQMTDDKFTKTYFFTFGPESDAWTDFKSVSLSVGVSQLAKKLKAGFTNFEKTLEGKVRCEQFLDGSDEVILK